MSRPTLKIEDFINSANKTHNYKYNYESSIYTGAKNKIKINCLIHGEFEQIAGNHINGAGCKKCNINKKSLALEDFIKKASKIHNNKYNYDKTLYINNYKNILIICPIHNEFEQKPANHLNGRGCNKCSGKNKKHLQEFINESNIVFNNKYSYSKSIYKGAHISLIITCPIHGDFNKDPGHHLNGGGCSECKGNYKGTTEIFIKQANLIHGNKYNYDKVIYLKASEKIIINCYLHGIFLQTPHNHLHGKGCIKCTTNISKLETAWLNSLNIKKEYRQGVLKINNKLIKPDAFDPITNTIYEFYGDFWHGNPIKFKPENINTSNKKTFGELYRKTIERQDLIKQAGYNLVFIWENDWKKK